MQLVLLLSMACLLCLSWAPAAAAPVTQAQPQGLASGQEFLQNCEQLAEADLRAELNAISQQVFAVEPGTGVLASPVAIAEIVDEQWSALAVGDVIDVEVDRAIAQVRSDADIWSQFLSGWSPAKAEELTRQVATLAFGSESFRHKMDELSVAVAEAISVEMAALSAESAALTTVCLSQYVDERYSQAIFAAFTDEIQSQTEDVAMAEGDELASGLLTVVTSHKSALGGVGVIIASQVAKRVVMRIGQSISRRVAGRIVGRVIGKAGATVIPAVGWVIGAGLIVYDVVESREGALPQIRDTLKGDAVEQGIRDEIAAGVESELALAAPQIARDVANDLYASWLDFQRKYRQVLELADEDPVFRVLLAQTDDVVDVAALVDAGIGAVGREGVIAAIADRSFERVLALPEAAVEILRTEGSFAAVLAWADVAGARLEAVVDAELYKHLSPEAVTPERLDTMLAFDEPGVLANLALLDPAAMTVLTSIASDSLAQLAGVYTADDLQWLAQYLTVLEQPQANQLLIDLLEAPKQIDLLKDTAVLNLIEKGNDVHSTLVFLAEPNSIMATLSHLAALFTGRLSWSLFVHRYSLPLAVLLVGVPCLAAVALLYHGFLWISAPWRKTLALLRRPAQPN